MTSHPALTVDADAENRLSKCCKLDEVMDELYRCSPLEWWLEGDEGEQWFPRNLEQLLSEDVVLGVDIRTPCPQRQIKEFSPSRLMPGGSFEVVSGLIMNTSEYRCVDLIVTRDGEMLPTGASNLTLLSCSPATAAAPGEVTKCCPPSSLLGPDLATCRPLPPAAPLAWSSDIRPEEDDSASAALLLGPPHALRA
jgi:hypothetical protein